MINDTLRKLARELAMYRLFNGGTMINDTLRKIARELAMYRLREYPWCGAHGKAKEIASVYFCDGGPLSDRLPCDRAHVIFGCNEGREHIVKYLLSVTDHERERIEIARENPAFGPSPLSALMMAAPALGPIGAVVSGIGSALRDAQYLPPDAPELEAFTLKQMGVKSAAPVPVICPCGCKKVMAYGPPGYAFSMEDEGIFRCWGDSCAWSCNKVGRPWEQFVDEVRKHVRLHNAEAVRP